MFPRFFGNGNSGGSISGASGAPVPKFKVSESLRNSATVLGKVSCQSRIYTSESGSKHVILGGTVGLGAAILACSSANAREAHEPKGKPTTDRLSKWEENWRIGRTNWHIDAVNETILKNEKNWLSSSSTPVRVLIPLCGKTVDLAYLAGKENVSEVVGIEGVAKACTEYVKENPKLKMKKKKKAYGGLVPYSGEKVKLLCGDFFHFQDPASFDKIWDRGSLVAINPSLRKEYVAVVSSVLKPGGVILLEALDRKAGADSAKQAGPPFSLTPDHISQLFPSDKYNVKRVSRKNLLKDKYDERYQRFRDGGLTVFNQDVYLIKKK